MSQYTINEYILQDFNILEKLGEGSQASVYKVIEVKEFESYPDTYHIYPTNKYALKVI